MSASSVDQLHTEMRMRDPPFHVVPLILHVPSCWTVSTTRRVRRSVIAEARQTVARLTTVAAM